MAGILVKRLVMVRESRTHISIMPLIRGCVELFPALGPSVLIKINAE